MRFSSKDEFQENQFNSLVTNREKNGLKFQVAFEK